MSPIQKRKAALLRSCLKRYMKMLQLNADDAPEKKWSLAVALILEEMCQCQCCDINSSAKEKTTLANTINTLENQESKFMLIDLLSEMVVEPHPMNNKGHAVLLSFLVKKALSESHLRICKESNTDYIAAANDAERRLHKYLFMEKRYG